MDRFGSARLPRAGGRRGGGCPRVRPVAGGARRSARHNIPGIPLPGPVAVGILGGPIYDVVYRIQVPPSTLIVAALTGTAGTDFDLYLFNSTATSVYSTVGQVAKSTGPTSTETVSYPSRDGGTYYVDLNGATAVEGTFRLIVQALPGRIPPQVSMTLAGGRSASNTASASRSPCLRRTRSPRSPMSPSARMGTRGEHWLAFSPAMSFEFSAGDGKRTLWAKVRDALGLESAPTAASIRIDTVGPGVVSVVPSPGSSVAGLRPRVSVTFDEAMDAASWTTLGLIVQAPDATLVSGTAGYDAATKTGWWTPTQNLSPGGVYIFTLGTVTDIAGNHPAPLGSWTLTVLAPVTLTLEAPTVVPYGSPVRLDVGLLGAPAPAYVTVVGLPAGASQPVPVANRPDRRRGGERRSQTGDQRRLPRRLPGSASDRLGHRRSRRPRPPTRCPCRSRASVLRTAHRGTSVAVTARITPAAGSIVSRSSSTSTTPSRASTEPSGRSRVRPTPTGVAA